MTTKPAPARLSDLTVYDRDYLSPADLRGKVHQVTLERISVRACYDPRQRTEVDKLMLHFTGRRRGLILSRPAATACEKVWSDTLAHWIGQRATIAPTVAQNGRETISIEPLPPTAAAVAQQVAGEEATA